MLNPGLTFKHTHIHKAQVGNEVLKCADSVCACGIVCLSLLMLCFVAEKGIFDKETDFNNT